MGSASALPESSNAVYTSCYCEENIYWLVKRFLSGEEKWDVFAVFISNPTRTVALWKQRAASSGEVPIIWDYHVILALRERLQVSIQSESFLTGGDTWIYDLDTCLPIPCHSNVYIGETFPLGGDTASHYQSWFRVIPGDVYLNNFASDRSHMTEQTDAPGGEIRYSIQPPPCSVICGPKAAEHGIRNNLMTHFVSMVGEEKGFGTVMDFDAFRTWCRPSE